MEPRTNEEIINRQEAQRGQKRILASGYLESNEKAATLILKEWLTIREELDELAREIRKLKEFLSSADLRTSEAREALDKLRLLNDRYEQLIKDKKKAEVDLKDLGWQIPEETDYRQDLEIWDSKEAIRVLSFLESSEDYKNAEQEAIILSLVGLTGERAIELRRKMLKEGVDPNNILLSLIGAGSREAFELRKEIILKRNANPEAIALSLVGLESKYAHGFRHLLASRKSDGLFLSLYSLIGVADAIADKIRNKCLRFKKKEIQSALARTLIGLSDIDSMSLREALLERGTNLNDIFISLIGIDTEDAMNFRKNSFENAVEDARESGWGEGSYGPLANAAAKSLIGVGNDDSMEWRRELISMGADANEIARSLTFVNNNKATELREELWQGKVGRLGEEPVILEEPPDSNTLLISLVGVDDSASMDLRAKLMEGDAKPISLAYSLAGVDIPFEVPPVSAPGAETLRKKYLGDNPELLALSYSRRNIYNDIVAYQNLIGFSITEF